MRARSFRQIPGMSWPREMRPVPIAPTLMRLPGAEAPKTDAGTIAGKPATSVALLAVLTKSRRVVRSWDMQGPAVFRRQPEAPESGIVPAAFRRKLV